MSLISRWDGINRFGMIEKLLCCVQVRRKRWDKVAWNQMEEVEDNCKGGEGKAEYVSKLHSHEWDN